MGGGGGGQGGQISSRHRRRYVASTPFQWHVPARFLINQCQIITFLILKSDIIIFGIIKCDFLFYIDNGMLCVLIRIDEAILMRTHDILSVKENRKIIPIMPPDLAL